MPTQSPAEPPSHAPGPLHPPSREPVLVVGGGNMAQAIVRGSLAAGVLDPAFVRVLEPDQGKHAVHRSLGVHADADADASASWFEEHANAVTQGQVLLCVKPQVLRAAAAGVQRVMARSRVVISILAGTTSQIVRAAMGENARVVRAMPNLAASIAQGATALCLGQGAREGDDALARRIFSAVGPCVITLPESQFDAFTALAGSGPAYLFYLAQAMIEGGVRAGLSHEHARDASIQTLLGAAMMLTRSGQSPEELRAAVTSKGGTTAAAVAVLDQHGVRKAVGDAIIAGAARGAELARLASGT